jgi:hypothetical protein
MFKPFTPSNPSFLENISFKISPSNIFAYFPFDTSSYPTDRIYNNYVYTVNTTFGSSGLFSESIELNRSTSSLASSEPNTLDTTRNGSCSISGWFFLTSNPTGTGASDRSLFRLSGGLTNNSNAFIESAYELNAGAYRFYLQISNVGKSPSANITIALNTWHHVCLVYTGTVAYLYINNVLRAQLTNSYLGTQNFGPYYSIGQSNLAIDGKVDDVTIWTRALTTDEISILSNSSTGPFMR